MNMEQIERICISVNTVCNLGCKYCYFYHPENRVSKELPLDEAEIIKILDQAYIYHQKYQFKKKIKVNFVGSGEPLINWKIIRNAIRQFWDKYPDQEVIKFYTVTNATLVTHKIAQEMKELKVIPSVSIDGPKEIHDKYRLTHKQQGTFDRVIKGVEVLREVGFDVAINTTLSRDLLFGLDGFVEFVKEYGFKKVIFDRLVDTPDFIDPISYAEYYQFLENIHGKFQAAKMTDVEVGNLEAYKRNFQGKPDKVCTMFGGSCGAGSNFVIYMGKDVYPCGRMFGKEEWLLGSIDDPIEEFTQRMKKH